MNNIDKEQRNELIKILDALIETIVIMRKEQKDYILAQNEREAREWITFLKEHEDKEELKSLENEISDRFFYKFDVQVGNSELDNRRVELMEMYISKSNDFLKKY
ncbi:MAG: hypothetical protein HDR25_03640 [Lachnospiraceae bacterium]|nr:hypothetical protein [Lachnospiraceae bacterium]